MSAIINGTDLNSIAYDIGLKSGDTLISINGSEINDVIDYMYYSNGEMLKVLVTSDGELKEFEIEKDEGEPLGINFDTYLIDKQKSCKNKCIFCFIDQLPKGLRETLYFKDDDARLSFLMGNYVTLTNLTEKDIERICLMRISPINVSVHTTDPALRVEMMKNPNAAKINEQLNKLASSGITLNCQIVLCKGVNDGAALQKTLTDLKTLYPSVASVSIVPVGITRHRDGLYPLEPFTKEDCRQVIDLITGISDECKKEYGTRLFYPSDEFFVVGELELPKEDYYDGFLQIENGVGMCTSLLSELERAVEDLDYDEMPCECAIITGVLAKEVMRRAVEMIKKKRPCLKCDIYPIVNNFFGERITVSGLVTATDIISQLEDKILPVRVLIPSCMLRSEQDMFLDSITVSEVENRLGRKLTLTYNDGYDFMNKIIGEGER